MIYIYVDTNFRSIEYLPILLPSVSLEPREVFITSATVHLSFIRTKKMRILHIPMFPFFANIKAEGNEELGLVTLKGINIYFSESN